MFEFAARHLQFVVCVGVGHAGAEEHLAAYAPFFLRTQVAPIWCQPWLTPSPFCSFPPSLAMMRFSRYYVGLSSNPRP